MTHKENSGVSSARTAGIDIAEGEYIAFIDSDDYVDSDYLQELINTIRKTQVDMAASGIIMENWNGAECMGVVEYRFGGEKLYDTKALLEAWEHDFPAICMCGPCCKLYKKSIILKNKIRFALDQNCGEDTLFNLDFLEHCSTISATPKSFYHYRRDSGESLFSRFHKDTYEIHRGVYTAQWELMNKTGCNEKAMSEFKGRYFDMMVGGIHEYYRFYDLTSQEEKRELLEKIARDSYVNDLKIGQTRGIKNNIWLLLIKCKKYSLVMWLFKRHYKNGRKQETKH